MRPYIPVANTAKVEMIYDYNGIVAENVLHFEHEGPITLPDMFELATIMSDWWQGGLKSMFTVNNGLRRVRVTDLTSESSPVIEHNLGDEGNGSALVTDQQLPGNVTMAVKLASMLRGRSYRGRIYHVGLVETSVAGNRLAGGAAVFLGAEYAKLLTTVGLNGPWHLVVVSYYHNGAWRSIGIPTRVVNLSFDDNLDSQRRRLTNRGQ